MTGSAGSSPTAAGPLPDPVDEVRRIVMAAERAAIPLRAIGGLAVALRAPSVGRLFPERRYHDIDLVVAAGRPDAAVLLESLGYEPQRRFNRLNGADRLLFHDPGGRRVDVFVDRLRMCHELRLGERLVVDRLTVPLADLLLSKLQIVELTERDRQDALALLHDHELTPGDDGISVERIAAVCGRDWGWWRTATASLATLADRSAPAGDEGGDPGAERAAALDRARDRARELDARLRDGPRSWRWRARAVVGERRRWYDEPEEVR